MPKNTEYDTVKNLTKTKKWIEVKMTVINIFQMSNRLKSAIGGAALLSLGAQTQAETVEQAKDNLTQLIAQIPEAIVEVIKSGEGCDDSVLNTALETEDYEPSEQCSLVEGAMAKVGLAQINKALVERKITKAELSESVDKKLVQSEQNQTTIEVLAKRETELIAENEELDKQIVANLLE